MRDSHMVCIQIRTRMCLINFGFVAAASELRGVSMTKRKQSLSISLYIDFRWSWNLHLQTFTFTCPVKTQFIWNRTQWTWRMLNQVCLRHILAIQSFWCVSNENIYKIIMKSARAQTCTVRIVLDRFFYGQDKICDGRTPTGEKPFVSFRIDHEGEKQISPNI